MIEDYGEHCLVKTRAYDGVPELLRALARRRRAAGRALQQVGRADAARSSRPCSTRRTSSSWRARGRTRRSSPTRRWRWRSPPASGCRRRASSTSATRCVDMRTATAAGMVAVGAAWGFRTPEELVESGAGGRHRRAARAARRCAADAGRLAAAPVRPLASAPASRSSVEERRHERRVRGRRRRGPSPWPPRRQQHLGAGLSGDEHAGGVVPRREVELPVGVHVAGGEAAEVERRRAAAADVADAAQHRRHHGALRARAAPTP